MAMKDEKDRDWGQLVPFFGYGGPDTARENFNRTASAAGAAERPLRPARKPIPILGEEPKQDWANAVNRQKERIAKGWQEGGLYGAAAQVGKEVGYGLGEMYKSLSIPGSRDKYSWADITKRAALDIEKPMDQRLSPPNDKGYDYGKAFKSFYGFGGGGKDQRPSAPAEGTASQQAQAQAAAAAQGQDKTPDMPWQTETTAEGGFRAYRPGESVGSFQADSALKPGVPVESAFGKFTPMEGGGTFSRLQGLTADEYNAKANAVRAQREAIRSLRPTRGGGGGNDLSPSPYERQQMLKNYKKELNSIMRDSDKYRITARGASNKIEALNNWYSAAMGLSPQQEEAGKNRRAELAAATDIEQANIVSQGALAKEMLSPTANRFKTEYNEDIGAFVTSDTAYGGEPTVIDAFDSPTAFQTALRRAPKDVQTKYYQLLARAQSGTDVAAKTELDTLINQIKGGIF